MSDADSVRITDTTVQPVHGTPVAPEERFGSLDVLRGVAIVGILVMNIYAFAMPFSAYTNPLLMGGTEPHNLGIWFFTHIFVEQKFITIFAMMFGAGLVLMTDRAEAKGVRPAPVYFRRQFWLVIIGAIHGYLIWFGDILFVYALIGMMAYLFRRRSPKSLTIVACFLLVVAPMVNYGMYVQMADLKQQADELVAAAAAGQALNEEQQEIVTDWEESRALLAPNAEDMQEDLDTHLQGYAEIIAYRVPYVAKMQVFMIPVFGVWRIGGLMLIGMALMKLRVFTAERSRSFYRRMMVAGYAIGLPLTAFSAGNLHAHGYDGLYAMRIGMLPNYLGSIFVAFGHVGLVMLIARTGVLQRMMQRLAAVGRMALTNYLLHSVILTTVFYGYGLGLYGDLSRSWQMLLVATAVGLQLAVSPWWLSRFRFGPVEWLWRSLTYRERQPMRMVSANTR
jgi:uncharacterized protein